MSLKKVFGVYAAVLTPRHADASVDVPALRALIEFLMSKDIFSFALNGATGEFCLTTPPQLRTILRTVREVSGGQAQILCGIGAAGTSLALELADIAQRNDANDLLLPMPYFFPYQQEDLESFCRAVAAGTELPMLLYNLPQFSSGLDSETVRTLITEVPNIIGIKDSSGSLDILRDLTLHNVDACRIVGNDSALAPAMSEGLCDGVVSGVACAVPELIFSIYSQGPASPDFKRTVALLDAFIDRINLFPTPWGLKWALEARGILQASFAQPVTASRLAQADAMMQWFAEWRSELLLPVPIEQ